MRNIFKRYLKFATVGASGALIQMGITNFLFDKFAPENNKVAFMVGMVGIILLTSIWNFTFNHWWTWRDKAVNDDKVGSVED